MHYFSLCILFLITLHMRPELLCVLYGTSKRLKVFLIPSCLKKFVILFIPNIFTLDYALCEDAENKLCLPFILILVWNWGKNDVYNILIPQIIF